jgi:hypothetical protein
MQVFEHHGPGPARRPIVGAFLLFHRRPSTTITDARGTTEIPDFPPASLATQIISDSEI